MKTLNDYMQLSYRMEIVEDKDEGGFVVSYPEVPGCLRQKCYGFITLIESSEDSKDGINIWNELYYKQIGI